MIEKQKHESPTAFTLRLIRAEIIEECAKVCDKHAEWAESKITKNPSSSSSQMLATIANAANDCAAEIRDLVGCPADERGK